MLQLTIAVTLEGDGYPVGRLRKQAKGRCFTHCKTALIRLSKRKRVKGIELPFTLAWLLANLVLQAALFTLLPHQFLYVESLCSLVTLPMRLLKELPMHLYPQLDARHHFHLVDGLSLPDRYSVRCYH